MNTHKTTTVSRKIHFCAGHRVLNHESKCANLHGHNYIVWVYATADNLDKLGRVIDFSVLKEIVGGWIDEHWDHTTILYKEDKELLAVQDKMSVNKPVFVADFNPTAENMANYLLEVICPKLLEGRGITVDKIVIFETENCSAEASLDEFVMV